MIKTIEFKNALKLVSIGIILNTSFYYSKRKRTRHSADTLPRGIRDFNKIYIPAPADSELDDRLPASLKEGKFTFVLTVVRDKSGFKVSYVCRGYPVDEEKYICEASTEADAKTLLIIKLAKDGKIKI